MQYTKHTTPFFFYKHGRFLAEPQRAKKTQFLASIVLDFFEQKEQ